MGAGVATYEDLCRGLAGPREGLVEEFADTVAVGFAQQVLRAFLDAHGTAVRSGADQLSETLDRWVDADADFRTAWHPAFGLAGNTVAGRAVLPPTETAAQLGVWLATCGHPGRWSARFDSPQSLLWDRWVLAGVEELDVDTDGRTAAVTVRSGGTTTTAVFTRDGTDWDGDVPGIPIREPSAGHVTFLLAQALAAPELAFLRDDVVPESQWGGVAGRYAAAAALLNELAPEYPPWVGRSISQIVPLKGAAGTINSGSSQDAPGLTHLSFGGSPVELAEMLVHEGTHQYFYLATRLGPIDDGSDPTLYYSPVKRCGRPIHFITLAYHAFANVMLFYRQCAARGFDTPDGYVRRNIADLDTQLQQLELALTTSRALTPVGRALWEPLAERLHSR